MKAELVLERLEKERDDLDIKLEKLHSALCKEWKDETQEYLCTQQYNAMSLYAHILDERIADIEYKLQQKMAKDEDFGGKNDIFNEKIDLSLYKKDFKNIVNSATVNDNELIKEIFITYIV